MGVEHADRLVRVALSVHRDEGKTLGFATLAVFDDIHCGDGSGLRKEVFNSSDVVDLDKFPTYTLTSIVTAFSDRSVK